MKNLLVITGGSRGIGLKIVDLFLKKGWDVLNLSRSPCTLKGVTNLAVDLSAENWEGSLTLSQLRNRPKITLVHNAFFFERDSCESVASRPLMTALKVNLHAPMILNSLVVPEMLPGSSVIYIGSTLSSKAVKGCFSYIVAKHAMVGMMRATCQDLLEQRVHTVCVCPGFTETEMLLARADQDSDLITQLTQNVFEKRLIKPEEIADCVFFAAEHPVLNGSVLHANLGQKEF